MQRHISMIETLKMEAIAMDRKFSKKGNLKAIPPTKFSPLSYLSHQLRTPLTCILGAVEVLHNELLTAEQRDSANAVQQAGNQLLIAINNLLGNIQKSVPATPMQSSDISESALKILMVEDEPIIQKVHKSMLERMGHNVEIAANGKQALSLFKNNRYDLILMDVGLPDMTGIEVTAKIRNLENKQYHTPIIAITAYDKAEVEAKSTAVNIEQIITKPVASETLKIAIQRWVK